MTVARWIEALSVRCNVADATAVASEVEQLSIVDQGRLRTALDTPTVGPSRTEISRTSTGYRLVHYRHGEVQKRVVLRVMVDA